MSIVAGEFLDGVPFDILLDLSYVESGLRQLRVNQTSLQHLDNKAGVEICSATFVLTRLDLLDISSVDGAVTLLYLLINSFRRFRPGMPLVGSCSGAISTAC